MAKKITGGRGRVRILYADVEGDDETILSSINALQAVVSKASQPRTVRQIAPAGPQQSLPFPEDDEEDVVEGEFVESPTESPRPKAKRKPPQMSIVKELSLRPDGQPTLKDFFAEKKPETQLQQVTVFVFYLVRKAGLEKVTANHVYTCFKDKSSNLSSWSVDAVTQLSRENRSFGMSRNPAHASKWSPRR